MDDLQESVVHILDRHEFAFLLHFDEEERYEQETGDDETEQTLETDCLKRWNVFACEWRGG